MNLTQKSISTEVNEMRVQRLFRQARIPLLCSALALGSAIFPGCAKSAEPDPDKPLVFRMGIVDGETSPVYAGARDIAENVERNTDGKIKIVVVTGGALGDERGTVELCSQGDLDIASAANSVLTNWIPEMSILDQAYLWETEEQAHAAVDGPVGELIEQAAEEKLGVHVIGYLESGFRDTFTTTPVTTPEEFAGIKIRTMQNPYHMAAFESFGAMPTAMAYNEVFTALQQGTIDAAENAVSNCLSNGYYEVTKDVVFTKHAFTYIPVMMSDKSWNMIPEDLRKPFEEGVREGCIAQRQYLKETNEEAIEELKKKGVTFHEIDTSVLKEKYQAAAKAKGFTFDPEWQAAVDEVLREHPAPSEE